MKKKSASAGSKRSAAHSAPKTKKKAVRPLTDAELLELKDEDLNKVTGGMGASSVMAMGNARVMGNARSLRFGTTIAGRKGSAM